MKNPRRRNPRGFLDCLPKKDYFFFAAGFFVVFAAAFFLAAMMVLPKEVTQRRSRSVSTIDTSSIITQNPEIQNTEKKQSHAQVVDKTSGTRSTRQAYRWMTA
jgi:hypothetical protein